jgi:putative methanogenesis marker protein 1
VTAPASVPLVRSAPKIGGGGVHRTVSARVTCQRMEPILSKIGVTRIADITGLDRLGIPVYSCVRPSANKNSVSITCGKGASRSQARAGAIMEAIEYACAEPGELPGRIETYERLARSENALDPSELNLPVWTPYRSDRPIEWFPARELMTGESCWVPANTVFHPYIPSGPLMILRGSTNGLASGNTAEEAICHGLAELIERDSWSLCWVRVRHGRGDRYAGPDLADASRGLNRMIGRFDRAGVRLFLRDITSELNVPAYYAASFEQVAHGALAHEGMGAHPDPEVALTRAVTEAAQSRAADIQGSREDIGYWRRRAGNGKVTGTEWSLTMPAFTTKSLKTSGRRHSDIRDDIFWMAERLACSGMRRILVADLTRSDLDVCVVRVIVPGLECVSIDEYRVGPRALAAVAEAQADAGDPRQ